ncbi:MAG: Hsp20/alpha crystallin family protein [Gammaproteobacteria bacterium]|nr:Hsp20/alpha crystallin family protein [Gammaproteobacteria bacterium]NNJ50999.1 Hsp20/alpha crystallin family protein [Gammaproteobacteria bacterium]
MQDSSQGPSNQGRSNQIIFTVMILLLFVIAGMQTWYIVEIKRQLTSIQDQYGSIQSTVAKTQENKDRAAQSQKALAPGQPRSTGVPDKQTDQQLPADDKDLTSDYSTNSSTGNPSPNPPYYAQRWDPYREIERMRREMERAFDHPYAPYNRPDFRRHFSKDISEPKMDVREDENQYTVLVNIPGADAKSLSVDLDRQRLTVSGKQEYEKQDRDASGRIIFSERRSGRFQRSITLAEPVAQKGMQTRIDNGVLTITIPKIKY